MFNFFEIFPEVEGYAFVAHVVEECVVDFVVDKAEEVFAAIEETHVDAECGKHTGVFGSDYTGTNEEHGFGEFGHGVAGFPHGIGVDDVDVIEGDSGCAVGG